jgi:SNF2 family DNA or RNA helicase
LQRKQYEEFERDAELTQGAESLVATGVLAEYTRLRQLASTACSVVGDRLVPTADSGKLEYLLQRLDEQGIVPGQPPSPDASAAVVASHSSQFINIVAKYLQSKGIATALITGAVSGKQRTKVIKQFQSGVGPRVICMTTTSGGVAITLDRADSVHILDETWDPDDQAQLEERVFNITKTHQIMVLYYRSKNTIEEDIYKVANGKRITTKNILDIQRQIYRQKP